MANGNQMYEVLDGESLLTNKPKPSSKVAFWLITVICSVIASGVFGYWHNQISYAVSYKFFNEVIFPMFFTVDTANLPPINEDAAGWIGVQSTWWVGLIIGSVLASIGLYHSTLKNMYRYTTIAIAVALFVAFIIGIVGLAVGKYILSNGSNFTAASTMQNASYAGGLVGLIVASAYSLKKRSKANV